MKLRLSALILYITLTSFNAQSSDEKNLAPMKSFNLTMMINRIPFLTELHTFYTPDDSKLHVVFHLTTSNGATKRAVQNYLFSEEKKQQFFDKIKTKKPCISENELEKLFQECQLKALEQATDPNNFASLEPFIKKALNFKFITKEIVNVSLNLTENHTPFIRPIRLFDTHEFSPEPPAIVFDTPNQTITQIFNTRHKDAEKKRLHEASWLYMNTLNK